MRYVCPICGYIYDEAVEGVPFESLPDSWSCPLCGAPKLMFEPEAAPQVQTGPPVPLPAQDDDGEMERLSPLALAALCSNLARGCEKQYREEEAALFQQIAAYFTAAAQGEGDRGAQRICVWGEKVTNMLYALLGRYQREGEAFLENTQVWVCSVCGFLYIGDAPPALCPVCKVPAWKFDKIEGRRPA